MRKVADIAGALANFVTGIAYFGHIIRSIFHSTSGWIGGVLEALDFASAIANAIAGWLRWSMTLYKNAGVFGRFVVNAIGVGLSGLIHATPVGMAEDLLTQTAEGVVYRLTGLDRADIAEHGAQAAISLVQGVVDHWENNMDESTAKNVCGNFIVQAVNPCQ
jgi:hypothetical protein